MKVTAHEKQIAKRLGVTPTGLAVLVRAAARADGLVRGLAAGNPGTACVPLREKGFVESRPAPHYGQQITDAGREIVRQARAMGW